MPSAHGSPQQSVRFFDLVYSMQERCLNSDEPQCKMFRVSSNTCLTFLPSDQLFSQIGNYQCNMSGVGDEEKCKLPSVIVEGNQTVGIVLPPEKDLLPDPRTNSIMQFCLQPGGPVGINLPPCDQFSKTEEECAKNPFNNDPRCHCGTRFGPYADQQDRLKASVLCRDGEEEVVRVCCYDKFSQGWYQIKADDSTFKCPWEETAPAAPKAAPAEPAPPAPPAPGPMQP